MKEGVFSRLERCASLPTVPAVAVRVLELCRVAEPDVEQIAKTIGNDPALSAKLLKMINSPVFGLKQEVRTVRHAVAMLGIISVRTLALSFSLAQGLRKKEQSALSTLWRRSAIAAVAARELAQLTKKTDREEAFLGALLQDLGMLALGQISGSRFELFAHIEDHAKVREAEVAEFGGDHAEAGAWLMQRWKLPPAFTEVVRYSHDASEIPSTVPEDIARLVRVVAASGPIADIWIHPDTAAASRGARDVAQAMLGLESEQFEAILDRVRANMEQVSSYLDVELGDSGDLTFILDQAKEALVELSLSASSSAQATIGQLQQRTRELEVVTTTDKLTGVGNRAFLEATLSEEFERAARRSGALSIVMVDLDHFKSINDSWGHLTGDRVLEETGLALRKSVRPRDYVGRYGGEEFMLILPDTDAAGSAIVAERLRARIANTPIALPEGQTLVVTASLGCASFDRAEHASARELIAAADRALYGAKRSGRNRVVRATDPEAVAMAGESQTQMRAIAK